MTAGRGVSVAAGVDFIYGTLNSFNYFLYLHIIRVVWPLFLAMPCYTRRRGALRNTDYFKE